MFDKNSFFRMIVYEKDDEFTAKVTVFSDICKKNV